MRAIDILKAESNISVLKRHVLRFASGNTMEVFATPITLAERKTAGENARSDETLELNLSLLVMKCKDKNGEPLFTVGDLPELRRLVTAELVSELVNNLYRIPSGDDDEALTPKPSAPAFGKTPT